MTDDKDRRCLLSMLEQYFCIDFHTPNRPLITAAAMAGTHAVTRSNPELASGAGSKWVAPDASVTNYSEYLSFIESMPNVAEPEVFGLHGNAHITRGIREAYLMFDGVLATERSSTVGTVPSSEKVAKQETSSSKSSAPVAATRSRDQQINEVALDILSKLKEYDFDIDLVTAKYPVTWGESMNTVLLQELARFNRLLAVIKDSLKSLLKALDGMVLMSSSLDKLGSDMFYGIVPSVWLQRSYPSLKPLGSYIADLVERLNFFNQWIIHGVPKLFWLSGFFFTQSFLTGTLQNFARKYTVAIDEIEFEAEYLPKTAKEMRANIQNLNAPTDGVYVYGAYLEGCQWDYHRKMIGESEPKVLYSAAPVMWMRPSKRSELKEFNNYNCPVYKTSERKGTLSTTGHSTNFVVYIRLPTDRVSDHWVRRGVALLLQLDD